MHLKWIKTLFLASISIISSNASAVFDYTCDPNSAYCVFIKGDASLPAETLVTANLSFIINKESFSYFSEQKVAAKNFFALGFPVQLIADTHMTHLKIAVTKIDNQFIQNCEISDIAESITPKMHTLTLSATKTPTGVTYQCSIDH